MAKTGTLYTYQDNFRAFKILIAAQYSGSKVELAKGFKFGETNQSNDFLKKFLTGKVPAFETSSGDCILESNAISYYVSNEQLRGKSELDQSLVQQWINFADSEILPAASSWVFPVLGALPPNRNEVNKAKDELSKALNVLNTHLLKKTYLVGERITLADISVFCTLLQAYKHVMDPAYRQAFTNVNRWFETLLNQPQFKTVLGTVKLCDKEAKLEAPKKEEKKKEEKKQEKKQDKPKEKAKTPAPEDDDLPPELQQPKQKDPFADYPKGTWVMDDFKRFYSNNPETKAIPYFWEKFDPKHYSIWHCEYKYPEELTLVFMSCNLMSGMMQRLDKLRKNAFGSMILFGEDNKSTISGIWIWLGHDLAFELSDDWKVDYESYSWKKLDPSNEDHRKLVDFYLLGEGELNGQQVNQGKIFK